MSMSKSKKGRSGRELTGDDRVKIRRLRASGMEINDIAKTIKRSYFYVQSRLKRKYMPQKLKKKKKVKK